MRWIISGIVGLVAVALVSLAAVTGGLYWQRVETLGEQAAREELGPLAQKQIPLVFTYDYKTVERSLTNAYPMLTPDVPQRVRGPGDIRHHSAGARA